MKRPIQPKNSKKGKAVKKDKFILQAPKGMHDILPQDQIFWDKLRKTTKDIADFYNFSRIDTPILESVEIFERAVGTSTDIVEKQMYSVKTKSRKERLVMRPEGTAPVMRAYIEHGLSHLGQPLKLYYIGPLFRYESPQAGRFRQFHTTGFEILGGGDDPIYDAQVVLATYRFMEEMRIKNLTVQINSIGCKTCRPAYRRKLVEYYKRRQNELCRDCKRRLTVNPLRLLDCKDKSCEALKANAPIAIDNLCSACKNHFKSVLEYLDELKLSYVLNYYLVRGLDYYNRTVFEIVAEGLDYSLAGGGRYDYLAESLGGKRVMAVGSGIGLERVIEAIKAKGIAVSAKSRLKIFLVHVGDQAKKQSLSLIEEFRRAGIGVIESLGKDSLSAQLELANKRGAPFALIIGQKEVFEESVIVRDMKTGAQETVPVKKVVNQIKKRM